jgi:hypothetical protein
VKEFGWRKHRDPEFPGPQEVFLIVRDDVGEGLDTLFSYKMSLKSALDSHTR